MMVRVWNTDRPPVTGTVRPQCGKPSSIACTVNTISVTNASLGLEAAGAAAVGV
jgi:hypothetical protein